MRLLELLFQIPALDPYSPYRPSEAQYRRKDRHDYRPHLELHLPVYPVDPTAGALLFFSNPFTVSSSRRSVAYSGGHEPPSAASEAAGSRPGTRTRDARRRV